MKKSCDCDGLDRSGLVSGSSNSKLENIKLRTVLFPLTLLAEMRLTFFSVPNCPPIGLRRMRCDPFHLIDFDAIGRNSVSFTGTVTDSG